MLKAGFIPDDIEIKRKTQWIDNYNALINLKNESDFQLKSHLFFNKPSAIRVFKALLFDVILFLGTWGCT